MEMIVSETFVRTWFTLQSQLISGLQLAHVDLQGASVRPDGLSVTFPSNQYYSDELALAAKLARKSGAPVTGSAISLEDGAPMLRVAYPLHLSGHADGAVVVEVKGPMEQQQVVLQMLKWGEGWLNLALSQSGEERRNVGYSELMGAALAQDNYQDALVLVLASSSLKTGSARVALGRAGKNGVVLEAVSGVSDLDSQCLRVQLLEAAMSESLQIEQSVIWTKAASDPELLVSHRKLAESGKLVGICSVPIHFGVRESLVFCFEYPNALSNKAGALSLCEEFASVVFPVLELHRNVNRSWWQRFKSLCVEGSLDLLSFHERRTKAVLSIGILSFAIILMSDAQYRVSAPATLEGAVQRAVVAPFDGYILDALAKAGQDVAKGDVLARLDDRELQGELRKLRAEQFELNEQHRQAVVTLDHGMAKVLESQVEQAQARLSLVNDQLTRTELRAPLDGVVISGDWSRSLGVPIVRGEVLFQVAPLDHYKVSLMVGDRDIAGLAKGQTGEVILSALPEHRIAFLVTNISTLAPSDAAEPVFRVEATLVGAVPALRPGMQGVARVTVGERSRWWIWTHSLIDLLRLKMWRSQP